MTTDQQASPQLAEKLLTYLRHATATPTLTYADPLTQLQGGYETHTYRFRLANPPQELAGALVLRLYPAFFGTHNAMWESTVQRVLAGTGYPVPDVRLTCTDMDVLGGAFFLMSFLPGQPLMTAPPETVPIRLGKLHAALHQLDPAPLVAALTAQEVSPAAYGLARRMTYLQTEAEKHTWLQPLVDWLHDHRPTEPARLAICHGDFHPFNILIDGEQVTAVLDWPNFLIADPLLDVATTLLLITTAGKHGAATLPGMAHVDWDQVGQLYLGAYQAERELDLTDLAYYQTRRAAHALLEGARGQLVWQQPGVVADLRRLIYDVTGIDPQA